MRRFLVLLAAAVFALPATPADALSSPMRLRVRATPAPVTVNVSFGEKTLSGYGGEPVAEAPLSNLSGVGCSDFTVDANSHLVPSGTYGATKTFALAAGQTYACVGASGQAYAISLLAKAAHVRFLPADTATTTQYRVQIAKAGGSTGALTCGDTVWVRSGESPATSIWALPVPAAANNSWTDPACYSSGPLTVRSVVVDNALDSNGNPRRQHGAIFRGININTSTSGQIHLPLHFRDVQFNAAFAGLTLRYATSGWGVSVDNANFFNTCVSCTTPDKAEGIILNGGNDPTRPVFATNLNFTGMGRGVSVGSIPAAGVNGYATISRVLCVNPAEDCIAVGVTNSPTQPGVSNPTITDNTAIGSGIGGHPDFIQFQGVKDGSTTTVGGFVARNAYVTNDNPFGLQAYFFDDSVGTGRYVNLNLRQNIGATTALQGIMLNRFNAPTVQANTIVQDLQAVADNTSIRVSTGGGGTDGVFNYNAVSTAQSLTEQTGVVVSSPVAVLAKTVAAYRVAFPNWTNSGIRSRADILRAYTPANLAVASGGMRNPDGTFNGALFPACPGQTIGAWNDLTVWNCADLGWLAAHPPAN